MTFKQLLLFITLPLYILDQATKFWTVCNMEPPYPVQRIHLIDGWLEWVRVHNQGVAFGIGNGTSWAPIVFLLVPVIALVLLRVFWRKGLFEPPVAKFALALLLCGIFGNLTDRLIQGFLLKNYQDGSFWERLSQGYVVDFVSVKLPLFDKLMPKSGGWWPAFNVADSCICIAAVLILISGWKEDQDVQKKAG